MNPADIGITWQEIIVAVFVAGGFYAQFKAIRSDIRRLEKKQDKYNNLQERMLKQELWTKMHEKEHEKNAEIQQDK